MSRSTIGGVAGAIIGFVASGYNPQGAYWGWVIGSGVGALTDNTKTYGPRLQDAGQQTSQDGTPRTYGYGTFPTSGVILWRDKRKEIEDEQGKGGPSQVTFRYEWSYAIGVCLGPVNGLLIVRRAGTIVYDTRTNEELLAIGYTPEEIAKTRSAQAKWLGNAKIYKGDEDQLPDPTIQAVKGVNNTPAYRGYCYIVLTNEDVTNDGGAIPIYDFVVSECGTSTEVDPGNPQYPAHLLITGGGGGGIPETFASALASTSPAYVALDLGSGADIAGAVGAYHEESRTWTTTNGADVRTSIDNRVSWQSGTISSPYAMGSMVGGSEGWAAVVGNKGSPPTLFVAPPDLPLVFTNVPISVTSTIGTDVSASVQKAPNISKVGDYYILSMERGFYRSLTPQGPYVAVWDAHSEVAAGRDPNGANIVGWGDIVEFNGEWYALIEWHFYTTYRRYQMIKAADWEDWATFAIIVDKPRGASDLPAQLCVSDDGTQMVCYMTDGTLLVSENGFSAPIATGLTGPIRGSTGSGVIFRSGRKLAFSKGLFHVIGGDPYAITYEPQTMSASALIPVPISEPVSIVASSGQPPTGMYPIPDAGGSYVDRDGRVVAPDANTTERCTPRLSHIVAKQALKREITRIVTDELYETFVDGFRVATQTSPLANIQSLMSAYQFDGSEHDGKLWFLMRYQRELTFTITMDDLVEQTGDPFEWEITKENDLLRKVTVNYFDPMTNYTQTSQDWEMRSSTIKALGEGTFEMALTGTANWAKRGAEMSGRIAWAERRETKLKVPLWHAARHTGEWGQLIDKAGVAHIVRITQINDEGITRELTLRKTRHNAYESLAEGVASPLPTFPTGNVRGPTVSVVMNMPALRADDDKAGVYWAATGLLSTWRGTSLGLSRAPGAWLAGPSMSQSCTMGWLTSTLPSASKFGRDETNVLTVQLFPYCPKTLESTDEDGMYAEANAAALVYPSGKVEIIQFKNATLVAPNTYELTSLWRGRKDTAPGEHLEDAMFVLLDNAVRFVAISPSDVGKTVTFRGVSTGTDPDAADEDTLTFTSIESLREWQPYNVLVTPDGLGGYCVKWIGRGRLGNDRFPIDSQYFDGYEVRFTIGSVVHSVSTASQSVCVAAADLIGTFGTSMGVPDITVRAKSKIATNDDDFDSPPATPTDPNPSYPATIIGEPGDMYEGEGVLDYLGPTNNPPFQAYGGKTEQYFTGYIARNVTCQGSAPGSGIMVGIPLTAQTEDADTTMLASGPDVVGGPFTITDSVTALPMPAFAMMDELSPWGSKALVTLVTSPPRTTKRVASSGLGGLRSRAGFSTGERRCEFVIDDMPAGGRIAIGVLAGGVDAHLAPGTGSSFAHIVTANGTFAVEVDGSSGAVEVFELGVGLVASGTLPLTYAHDGKYRFGWVANDAQHPAVGASVYTNQGNEAWLITPTGAFGGVPNEAHVIPCGFDAEVAAANGYWPQGTQSLTAATAGGFSGTSVIYAYSEFAKSTGAWRIGMSAGTAARIGLCKAGHTGLLGQGGDSFGMYYDFAVIGSPMIVFDTTWAGQIRIPHPFYTMGRKIIFVCDFDAHTVEVWGKPQFSDYILLAVLTGLPSGAWVPAGNHAVEIINGASEISGATDWSVTKTP